MAHPWSRREQKCFCVEKAEEDALTASISATKLLSKWLGEGGQEMGGTKEADCTASCDNLTFLAVVHNRIA